MSARPARRRSAGVLAVASLLCLAPAAGAWWDAGHETVAAVAWRRLSPAARSEYGDLLREHPRFEEDFLAEMPPEVRAADRVSRDEWLFRRAGVWPDVVRKPEDDPPADGPDRRELYHRGTWHYVNIPLYLTAADEAGVRAKLDAGEISAPNTDFTVPAGVTADDAAGDAAGMNVVQALRYNLAVVRDRSNPAADRAVALCWVLHLGGDVHQPMHSVALFSDALYPEGDKGGNGVAVLETATQPGRNLHAVWDAAPGQTFTPVEVKLNADRLTADPGLAAAGEAAADVLDPAAWAEESRELAKWAVYTPDVLAFVRARERAAEAGERPDPAPLRAAPDYLSDAERLADRRLTEAGYRLGAVLGADDD